LFIFSWVAENLITSRFGSFTGRDKRVWYAWYKFMWIIELLYIVTLGVAIFLIITPFYFELSYNSSFIVNFWHWMSKSFLFNFLFFLLISLFLSLVIQINIKFYFYKKLLFFIFLILMVLNLLLFMQFYITFFAYFTDSLWYSKTKGNSYIQLSHEPWKWSWDLENRDHFQYNSSKTVFWYKNDGPFAESFFLINLYLFFIIVSVVLFWLILFRRVYNTNEVSYVYTISSISALRQFFYLFGFFYLIIFASIIIIYLKFPYEFLWVINTTSLFSHIL
jgi:hypothetical protein